MKKAGTIVGGVFIVAVVAIVLVFIISNTNSRTTDTLDINGVWRVYQHGENKVDDEYMSFDNGKIIDYRNGEEYASAEYTYADGVLSIPEILKEFTVAIKSNNYIILIEQNTIEWKLARISSSASNNLNITEVTVNSIVGEYDVTMVAGEKRNEEIMSFSEVSFVDKRNGKTFLTSEYTIESNSHLLHASEINKDFWVYLDGNNLVLIDCADRYVWELVKR